MQRDTKVLHQPGCSLTSGAHEQTAACRKVVTREALFKTAAGTELQGLSLLQGPAAERRLSHSILCCETRLQL